MKTTSEAMATMYCETCGFGVCCDEANHRPVMRISSLSETTRELDQMAFDLCYQSIRWSGLYKQLDNAAWDALAAAMVPQVRAKVDELINAEFTRLEGESQKASHDND